MIKSIKAVKGAKKFPCNWWPKVKAVQKGFKFKDGLNVILGPNGSGKTTLTRTIARLFFAEQGGRSTITQRAFMDLYDFGDEDSVFDSFEIEHDGGAVFYMNQEDTIGISGGGFDDDFFMDGFLNTKNHGSSGQTSITSLNRILGMVQECVDGGEIVDNRFGSRCNDTYQERVDKAMKLLKPNKDGRMVLILDEPDASLDLLNEIELWALIKAASQKIQVIVCTHSALALSLEDVNFIDMEKGYHKKCVEKLKEGK